MAPSYPYLIIGNGRLATHIAHYFDLLDLRYLKWARRTHALTQLATQAALAERVLLLISDDAIESFIAQHQALWQQKMLIHCSGALVISGVYSAHPPLSFTPRLYPLATYQAMPFILEKGSPSFIKLWPGLANPHYFIPAAKKAFYHSLCVMSMNFTCLLWQKFFNEMDAQFKIPPQALKIILQQVFTNLLQNPQQALTGPLARGDQKTLAANLQALTGDPYQQVYTAFMHAYQESL